MPTPGWVEALDTRWREAVVEPVRIRSGLVTFAAVVAGVVAVYNTLSGIAAITEDDQTEALNEVHRIGSQLEPPPS